MLFDYNIELKIIEFLFWTLVNSYKSFPCCFIYVYHKIMTINKIFCFNTNFFPNINWRHVQRKNDVNNVDISSLGAPWQNGPNKNKHAEQHKNTQHTMTQQTFRINSFVFFGLFYLIFLYDFSNDFSKMCYRLALSIHLCYYPHI